MRLDRYFALRFLGTFAAVFSIFVLILGFVGIVDQLRIFSGTPATFAEVVALTALSLPEGLYGIMPLIMIIATIALFLALARSSEMVVTRAAGRGALRAMVPTLLVALAIGILAVAILNPIVAATSRQYEARGDALKGSSSVLALGESGLWLRQGSDESQTVIRAEKATLNGTVLSGVTFITFSEARLPTRRISADRAELVEGAWQLDRAKSWPLVRGIIPEAQATTHETLSVPSTLTAEQIRHSFGTPSSIPIWDLPAFIDRLEQVGFSATRHQVWFQMELAQPVFLVSMVLIGATFTIRHQRGGRTGLMVLFAILLSFSISFLRNFAQVLGENSQIPIALAAWAPPLAAIGLSIGLLLHNEDG